MHFAYRLGVIVTSKNRVPRVIMLKKGNNYIHYSRGCSVSWLFRLCLLSMSFLLRPCCHYIDDSVLYLTTAYVGLVLVVLRCIIFGAMA